MSVSAFRPPWLGDIPELEKILRGCEPPIEISLTALSISRKDCPIVEQLLGSLISKCNHEPSEWELGMAKAYLAMDVQQILALWVEEGRKATLKESPLASMLEQGKQRKTVDVRGSLLPLKRNSPETAEEDEEVEEPEPKHARIAGGEKDFRCPYYLLNKRDPQHQDCKGKQFPNPRKLKEHIWRFTKPFKCPTCGEGFGREKTKAIHCDQRKVKCAPSAAVFEYEGSIEQQRDRGVERARNTTEILEHFGEYERQKSQGVGARDMNFSSVSPSQTAGPEWSPHDESPSSWSTPQQQNQLQLVYPSTPAQTPPHNSSFHQQHHSQHRPRQLSLQLQPQQQQQQQLHHQQSQQSPHSPTVPHYGHSPFGTRAASSPMFAPRPLPQVPQIIINDRPHDEIDEVLSAASYHSQPGTPMATSFFDAVSHQQQVDEMQAASERHHQQQQHLQQQQMQMAVTHQQAAMQHQQERETQENGSAAVRIFSNGYGSFGPCQFRIRTSAA